MSVDSPRLRKYDLRYSPECSVMHLVTGKDMSPIASRAVGAMRTESLGKVHFSSVGYDLRVEQTKGDRGGHLHEVSQILRADLLTKVEDQKPIRA